VEAVSRFKFAPGYKNGRPVNCLLRQNIHFGLEEERPNQSPEPTATAVTPPAAQESRQP
jgi:hypothetical protein